MSFGSDFSYNLLVVRNNAAVIRVWSPRLDLPVGHNPTKIFPAVTLSISEKKVSPNCIPCGGNIRVCSLLNKLLICSDAALVVAVDEIIFG